MKKLDEREELLRAGLFGVHEVVVFSLNKILLEELNEEDEDRKAKLEGRFLFFVFFFLFLFFFLTQRKVPCVLRGSCCVLRAVR